MMDDNKALLKAAVNAGATIGAIYEWVDRMEANGGATSISGVATYNAFLNSMKKNRARTETLIMIPLREAIAAAKSASTP